MRRMRRLTSAETGGLPGGLDFQRQNRRNAARCQPIKVAGLTITNAFRHSNNRASLENTKRSPGTGCFGFRLAFLEKDSCLPRNRFSAASDVRLRKRAAQNLKKSETAIFTAIISFETCRHRCRTSQSSHSYPTDFTGPPIFCGPHRCRTVTSRASMGGFGMNV